MKRLLLALVASAAAWSQTAVPAPTVDRIGFPENYDKLNLLYVFDRPDNRQVRTVYANDAAFGIRNGGQGAYPYGSLIIMETWRALQTAQGVAILDRNGRFQKDPAAAPTIFVMKKERGFGEGYRELRNGEWEYVAYRPDRTYSTAPSGTGSCAQCHLVGGAGKDFVMRANLHFNNGSGAVPDGVIKHYKFLPGEIRAKAGTTITIYNDDAVEHTIADDDQRGWTSVRLRGGNSIAITFPDTPGEFNFHCSIHPTMRGKVIVER